MKDYGISYIESSSVEDMFYETASEAVIDYVDKKYKISLQFRRFIDAYIWSWGESHYDIIFD